MTKTLLLLVIIAIVAVPARAAKIADSKHGFKRMVRWTLLFNAFYWLNLMYLYGRW